MLRYLPWVNSLLYACADSPLYENFGVFDTISLIRPNEHMGGHHPTFLRNGITTQVTHRIVPESNYFIAILIIW